MVDDIRTDAVQHWIEELLNYNFELDFFKELKSGVILCDLLNKIRPGTCQRYTHSKYGYVHKRNIDIFLSGCRSIGLDKSQCFKTKDLLNGSNLDSIISNLFSLNEISKSMEPYFSGPYIIETSNTNYLFRKKSITSNELTELERAKSLHELILIWLQQIEITNYKNESYWNTFKKLLSSHLELITDILTVSKLLNSAYIVHMKHKKQYCTILEILGYHFFNNSKIEANIEQYSELGMYDDNSELLLLKAHSSLSSTSSTNSMCGNNYNEYKSCQIIWEIICIILENGANPFIYVEYNRHSKCIKSTQCFKSVMHYYNALNILYIKCIISEDEFIDRFIYLISFAKTSWRDNGKPLPAILTRCRIGNMYYFFGDAIHSTLNPLMLPKLAIKLISLGYSIYNECKCNRNRIHDYSYKFILGQQEYLQFTSCLNNYKCDDDYQHSYFIDFLYYMKYINNNNNNNNNNDLLCFFNDNKWIYKVLKRLPILNKDWLIFIGNMIYPKIIDKVIIFLNEMIISNCNTNNGMIDEYFTIWNAWIDNNYQLNYVARLIPFAGLIFGEQMKKLIKYYSMYSTPYLKHILNTNYEFSNTWGKNSQLLFEILCDQRIPIKNIKYIINHIHSIYCDIYQFEGLYRTTEIYELV
eukprot:85956_1